MTAPHDLDAEAAVIGWCLTRPLDTAIVLDALSPGDFYRPAHGALIDALRQGVTTAQELGARTGVDGAIVIQAVRSAAGPWEIGDLVRYVGDLASRRRVLVALDEARRMTLDTTVDLSTAADVLRPVLVEAEDPTAVQPTTFGEFMSVDDGAYDWVVPNLLERSDRLLLTAGEGIGKSTLLRQCALAVSAGLHPFRLSPIPAKRVLYVDVENSPRQSRREFAKMRHLVEGADESLLAVEVRTNGLNLDLGPDRRWLAGAVKAHAPDLLVIGPLYQLHGAAPRGDTGGESHARELTRTLDRLRLTYGCALVMETHAPHGSMGSRDLRPFGSSVWMRWPDFGFGLRRNREMGPKAYELVPFRGQRDRRDWPRKLEHGLTWPWRATYDNKGEF